MVHNEFFLLVDMMMTMMMMMVVTRFDGDGSEAYDLIAFVQMMMLMMLLNPGQWFWFHKSPRLGRFLISWPG